MVVSFNMLFVSLNAQVKIGNNPTSIGTSSALEVESTNKAVLITRVANTAAITSPVNGMIIYDSTSQCFRCYSNSSWTACLGVGLAASTNGTGIVSSYGASACTVSSINGTMQPGVTVSGVTMSIYANVTALGSYNISSTSNGVTFSGSGTFSALGCQLITLTATGTPVSVGSFTWTTNTLPSTSASANVAIVAGIVTTLDCAGAINNGTLTSGTLANGVSSVLSYTGGNQGSYSAQSVSSTGVTGLTAVLAAGNFASGAGTITFDITGTPSTGGTANFAINVGGQTCTFSRAVVLPVGTITTLNCAGATNIGVPLKGGVAITGVTRIVVPYTGGNGGSYGAQTISSTGVTGVTATLSAGTLANGNGSLTFSLTGTPSGVGTASFVISIGGQSCTATRTVNMDWQITATSLSAAVGNGITYNGISPLNNGLGLRGIGYNGEAVPSGSTIDIAVNASSAGPYNISGTDVTSGLTYSASGNFVNAGLQTITLYNNNAVIPNTFRGVISLVLTGNFSSPSSFTIYPRIDVKSKPANATTVVDVVGAAGKTWMDRNLGALLANSGAITAEPFAMGSYFQWGRLSDGHEIGIFNGNAGFGIASYAALNNPTTTILSLGDVPGNNNYIINNTSPYDWRSSPNNNLWQGLSGTNNPCPSGYRLPTTAELNSELVANSTLATGGAIGFTLPGLIHTSFSSSNLPVTSPGIQAYYLTSTIEAAYPNTPGVIMLEKGSTNFIITIRSGSNGWSSNTAKSDAGSVRCVKGN